jgi:ppGpp synthetase/RelA/SpoT-type nucleotidyltranferase
VERPWSGTQLRKLGEAIRDNREPATGLPGYDEVMSWYNDLAAEVLAEISSIDFSSVAAAGFEPELAARAKTIDTLRDKLIRQHGMALPSIQDIAGVRLDGSMSLSQQTGVAHVIARHFGHDPADVVHDLRKSPHSGYRAVHVVLRLEGRGRVEVQVRTELQSEWANLYESLADVVGRGIRYDEPVASPVVSTFVKELQDLSIKGIAGVEQVFEQIRDPQAFRAFRSSRPASVPESLERILDRDLSEVETIRALEAELKAELRELRYGILQTMKGGL